MRLPERIVIDPTRALFEDPAAIRRKLDYYRHLSEQGLTTLPEDKFVEMDKDAKKFFNLIAEFCADTYPPRIFRISINNRINNAPRQKLEHIDQLIGPPLGLSKKFGRASFPGESVFYGALDPLTAIWETQPKAGEYVTLSEWKIKQGARLNVHYIIHPDQEMTTPESKDALIQHKIMQDTLHPLHQEIMNDLFSFFAEQFSKVVEPNNERDYFFSALCASSIIRPPNGREPNNNSDAVVYPSVKRARGISNVAIANNRVLDVLEPVALTIFDIGETQYDSIDPASNQSPILVGPAQVRVTEFDLDNGRIINPDINLEMKIIIDAHLKSKGLSPELNPF